LGLGSTAARATSTYLESGIRRRCAAGRLARCVPGCLARRTRRPGTTARRVSVGRPRLGGGGGRDGEGSDGRPAARRRRTRWRGEAARRRQIGSEEDVTARTADWSIGVGKNDHSVSSDNVLSLQWKSALHQPTDHLYFQPLDSYQGGHRERTALRRFNALFGS
jgi:hypothetical protein